MSVFPLFPNRLFCEYRQSLIVSPCRHELTELTRPFGQTLATSLSLPLPSRGHLNSMCSRGTD